MDSIKRKVRVIRDRPILEALDATGCQIYADEPALMSVSRGINEEVEITFVFFYRELSYERLDEELKARGLKPADVFSLAAVNEADKNFLFEYPNGVQWKDRLGRKHFAAFDRSGTGRKVNVHCGGGPWPAGRWYAGVPL